MTILIAGLTMHERHLDRVKALGHNVVEFHFGEGVSLRECIASYEPDAVVVYMEYPLFALALADKPDRRYALMSAWHSRAHVSKHADAVLLINDSFVKNMVDTITTYREMIA